MLKSMMAAAGMLALVVPAGAEGLVVAYPHPYTLFQRDSSTEGVIRVRGAFPTAARPEKIEARFRGGPWLTLDANPSGGSFVGSIPAALGEGALELRSVGGSGATLTASVEPVAVGDLFLVAGQSNADGRGAAMVKLDPANPCLGYKFRRGAWSRGDDPSANDEDTASPWPLALNQLIPEEKVPMGFIAAAVGSTVAKQWRHVDGATAAKAWSPGGMFARASEMVRQATDGGMKIRAVLYHQGENDLSHHNNLSVLGDYAQYKANLHAVVDSFWDAYNVPVLVGQITNLGGDRQRNDNVRRAQQELWAEHPHALPGAVTYDIPPTDGVHYREVANMRAYAGRWAAAILAGVYGRRDMAGPKLLGLRREGAREFVLSYDQPMALKTWDGRAGVKAEGFRFLAEGQVLADAAVVSTEVRGKTVVVELNLDMPATLRVDYGSGSDGQGKATLRSAASGLPAPMLFGRSAPPPKATSFTPVPPGTPCRWPATEKFSGELSKRHQLAALIKDVKEAK